MRSVKKNDNSLSFFSEASFFSRANKPLLNHGGNLRLVREKYHLVKEEILDFSASINPVGLPSKVKKNITEFSGKIIHYPDPQSADLKKILAQVLNLKDKNILPSNGSIELIFLITFALKPKKVLIITPTFSEYENASKLAGSKVLFFNRKEPFNLSLNKLCGHLDNINLIFICNPDNPTGVIFPKEELLYLLKECKKKQIITVVDEVFIDFVKEVEYLTLIKELKGNPNLLIIRSFTKFFALPGLRIGYLIGNKYLIKRISKYQYPWSVNSLAQEVAKEVIVDSEYINYSRRYIFKEREYLFKRLEEIPFIKPFVPSANFIFCKLTSKVNSGELTKFLAIRGFLIRDCANFRGLSNKFIRIAVRKRVDNKKLIKVLKEVLLV